MATATKEKPSKKQEKEVVDELAQEIDAQIEALEPISISVERTLTHLDTKETKKFVQHEMSYMTKLKFFRLLSSTIRIASESQGGTIADFLQETIGGGQMSLLVSQGYSKEQAEAISSNQFMSTILRLIELVPDFAEETYVLALGARPNDHQWVREALESLDDDEGVDILEVFIAQNAKAIRRFFDRHLRRLAQRFNAEVLNQESETTT